MSDDMARVLRWLGGIRRPGPTTDGGTLPGSMSAQAYDRHMREARRAIARGWIQLLALEWRTSAAGHAALEARERERLARRLHPLQPACQLS